MKLLCKHSSAHQHHHISCICMYFLAETVRAMTHVINQGMAMYWGTSRWSPMEIMVRVSFICVEACPNKFSNTQKVVFRSMISSAALGFPYFIRMKKNVISSFAFRSLISSPPCLLLGSILSGAAVQPDSPHLWAGWIPHVPEREGGGAATWALP